jgi:hypothetical protein
LAIETSRLHGTWGRGELRRAVAQQARGVDLRLAVGEHVADDLKLPDRLLELHALVRVANRCRHGFLRVAHVGVGHRAALELEVFGDDLPALADLAQQGVAGHAHFVEEDLGGAR